MFVKCVECDHILEDEEYLYKGKSYCDDCYRAVRKAVTGNSAESLLTFLLTISYSYNGKLEVKEVPTPRQLSANKNPC